jgi:hypothetical protein
LFNFVGVFETVFAVEASFERAGYFPGGMSWAATTRYFFAADFHSPRQGWLLAQAGSVICFFILWPTRVGLHRLQQKKRGNLTGGKRGGISRKEEDRFPKNPGVPCPELSV